MCQLILEFQPNNTLAIMMRADAFLKLGKIQFAFEDYLRAKEMIPQKKIVEKQLNKIRRIFQEKSYNW